MMINKHKFFMIHIYSNSRKLTMSLVRFYADLNLFMRRMLKLLMKIEKEMALRRRKIGVHIFYKQITPDGFDATQDK